MAGRELARLVDPAALDAGSGPRARIGVDVPTDWLVAGAEVELVLPMRIGCAHCEGGGCDGCGRSGALRLPPSSTERTVRLTLPRRSAGAVVRLVHPLDSDALEQLLIEIRPAAQASDHLRCLSPTSTTTGPRALSGDERRGAIIAAVALGALGALVAALAAGW